MAHLIDTTTGKAAIAYVGEKPWHGLGQELTQDAPISVWQKEAGLNWEALTEKVTFFTPEETAYQGVVKRIADDFNVVYRSDTKAALGVVGNRYKLVQPGEVLDFFDQLSKAAGFTLETAGALAGGKRIWAMAKVSDGKFVLNQNDKVVPYVLLATSFDGSMSTIAKFTSVRVVCQNTLSYSMEDRNKVIKIAHNTKFNAEEVRKSLGIAKNEFELFMLEMQQLASHTELSETAASVLTKELLEIPEETKRMHSGYNKIMQLFNGGAIGSNLSENQNSGWQWLNSVTEWVDHHRGRSQNTRLNSAWFGDGDKIKTTAKELVLSL
jgi:phage/plasmid-like protein (TIGR03299 family)